MSIQTQQPVTMEEEELFRQLSAKADDTRPSTTEEPYEPFAVIGQLHAAQAAQQRMHVPPPVTGYRALTDVEVSMINRIKAAGAALEALVAEVDMHLEAQAERSRYQLDGNAAVAEVARIRRAEPARWMAMARSDLQTGLMKLTRAIAQPSTF